MRSELPLLLLALMASVIWNIVTQVSVTNQIKFWRGQAAAAEKGCEGVRQQRDEALSLLAESQAKTVTAMTNWTELEAAFCSMEDTAYRATDYIYEIHGSRKRSPALDPDCSRSTQSHGNNSVRNTR